MRRRVSFGIAGRVLSGLLVLCAGIVLESCGGSNRSSVGGYVDADLNDKRVFLLLPDEGEYRLTDSAAFAWSRGIGDAAASGRVYSEFRTNLPTQLDLRYDSNTVHNFAAQSVAATNPLDANTDFDGEPTGWDWAKIDGAMKTGAIDFLVVLSDVAIANNNPGLTADRGRETVTGTVSLIDLPNRRLLVRESVSISVDDPRVPSDTYVILARKIAEELPFYNRTY